MSNENDGIVIPPVHSVTFVTYFDDDGNPHDLTFTLRRTDDASEISRKLWIQSIAESLARGRKPGDYSCPIASVEVSESGCDARVATLLFTVVPPEYYRGRTKPVSTKMTDEHRFVNNVFGYLLKRLPFTINEDDLSSRSKSWFHFFTIVLAAELNAYLSPPST